MPSSRSTRRVAGIARSQRRPGATPDDPRDGRDKPADQADAEQVRNARRALGAELKSYAAALDAGATKSQLERRRRALHNLAQRAGADAVEIVTGALAKLHVRKQP